MIDHDLPDDQCRCCEALQWAHMFVPENMYAKTRQLLPCDVCQQQVNLAGQLRVGNGDC